MQLFNNKQSALFFSTFFSSFLTVAVLFFGPNVALPLAQVVAYICLLIFVCRDEIERGKEEGRRLAVSALSY